MKNGIFVLVFLASALTRIFLLGSAPERLVKSLGQDLTCAVFSDQNYENENGNQYDLYIPAGLDRTQDQNLILYIHGGSFNSGSKADGEQLFSGLFCPVRNRVRTLCLPWDALDWYSRNAAFIARRTVRADSLVVEIIMLNDLAHPRERRAWTARESP